MYKVIASYQPSQDVLEGGNVSELLQAEKGDILIDGKFIDDDWFEAKSTVTERIGRIPRDHVISFCSSILNKEPLALTYSDSESERSTKDETPDVCEREESLAFESDVRREPNYVHMSSVDAVDSAPLQVDFDLNPLPKPRVNDDAKLSDDGTKLSDEGYNSGSYYSGETNENTQPLLPSTPVVSKQDEAGYEVPQINVDETLDTSIKSDDGKGKRRILKGIFRNRTFQDSAKQGTKADDLSEKYYNPPADIRDNYFLPKSNCPVVRVLLSLIVALAVSFTSLFVLLISVHPLLSFTISFVLFVVVFVIPVSLLHQGFLCVLALIFPSICSTRTKIAALVLLVALLVVGPIIGIANKLHLATTCNGIPSLNNDFWEPTPRVSTNQFSSLGALINNHPVHKRCKELFKNVDTECINRYNELSTACENSQVRTVIDKILCSKSREEFCSRNSTFISSCYVYKPKGLHATERVRRVVFYLLPVLILFLLSDAYLYNKVYLTTKDADNIYITQRLKELDCERKNRGLTDLILPLTRIEFQTYLLRGRCALSKAEKGSVMKWLFVLLVFGFISLCFILIEEHIHNALLHSLVPTCRKLYDVSTDIKYRVYIYIILGALFFVITVQSYILRLRSIICDCFYRDMVDIRAKHLYYKILHDRHSFGRHVRRKIQLLAEAKRLTRRISCLNMIYHILPHAIKWLCVKLSVRRCMICDSITCWKTVSCREGNCLAHYCYECYVDAGQICLTCKIPNSPPPVHPNMKPTPVAV